MTSGTDVHDAAIGDGGDSRVGDCGCCDVYADDIARPGQPAITPILKRAS